MGHRRCAVDPAVSPDPVAALESHYAGRRVLVTGHTGFKGAWLTAWLHRHILPP